MIVILPASFMAQDSTRGMLRSDGGTWLNGVQAPTAAAIFPDSLVQTQRGHSSRIDVAGSSVLILPETETQFQGDALVLTHGSLQLGTTTKMQVLVGCVSIAPTTAERTAYDVTDADGKVKIAASKNDVKIHVHGGALGKEKPEKSFDIILREGQTASRQERCAGAFDPRQAAGTGPALDNPWVIGTGVAAIGIFTCWLLCRGDTPASPSIP